MEESNQIKKDNNEISNEPMNEGKKRIIIIAVIVSISAIVLITILTSLLFGTGGNAPATKDPDNIYGPWKIDEVGSKENEAMEIAGKKLYKEANGTYINSTKNETRESITTTYFDWNVEAYFGGYDTTLNIPDIHIALEISSFNKTSQYYSETSSSYSIVNLSFDELFMEYTMGYSIYYASETNIGFELISNLIYDYKSYDLDEDGNKQLRYSSKTWYELVLLKFEETYWYPYDDLQQNTGTNIGYQDERYEDGVLVDSWEESYDEFYEHWLNNSYYYEYEFRPEYIDTTYSGYLKFIG